MFFSGCKFNDSCLLLGNDLWLFGQEYALGTFELRFRYCLVCRNNNFSRLIFMENIFISILTTMICFVGGIICVVTRIYNKNNYNSFKFIRKKNIQFSCPWNLPTSGYLFQLNYTTMGGQEHVVHVLIIGLWKYDLKIKILQVKWRKYDPHVPLRLPGNKHLRRTFVWAIVGGHK